MNIEQFENKDGKWLIFPNDAIAQHIKRGSLWEPHFKEVVKLINPGDVVVDAGANFGYNAVLIGKQLDGRGSLLCFEPQRIIYQQLNGNLILNEVFNALTFHNALGNDRRKVEMSPINYQNEWVNIGELSIGRGGEPVDMVTIDSLNLTQLNFIKIDVQGSELFVLIGGMESMLKYQPYLFIEIEDYQLAKFNVSREDLIYTIKEKLGYEMFTIANDYPCDHICCPSTKVKEVENLNLPLLRI